MSLADNSYCYTHYDHKYSPPPAADYDETSPPLPNADVLVHIVTIITCVPFSLMEEEDDPGMLNDEYKHRTFQKSFETKTDLLIIREEDEEEEDTTRANSYMASMLDDVNVPDYLHADCIREISTAARSIAATAAVKENGSGLPLTMSVHIGVVIVEEPEEEEEDYEDAVDQEEEEEEEDYKDAVEGELD